MRKWNWLRVVLAMAAILLAASWGLSLALHEGLARRFLLARLSASFGRPVEVGHFDFSLLHGPRLEVRSVSVMEDPRFGAEYFLRADELAASPQWSELLRGRLEFGNVSLTGASLNLVRASDGHWNIESWLPLALPSGKAQSSASAAAAALQRLEAAVRLKDIQIGAGRINFKQGVTKLAFALVDVRGQLDQDNAGRWSIDLQARPVRASVVPQEEGTLRVQGTVAGTSARLRPATLALSWEDASIADAMRLARGSDYGLRGTLAAEFTATIDDSPAESGAAASGWKISGGLRLAQLHRWDLAERMGDPAVNVSVTAEWRPGERELQLISGVIEAPHSRVSAAGEMSWQRGFSQSLRMVSGVGLEDVLAWRRAFLPGAENLTAQGTIGVNAKVAGWPPRLEEIALESSGATLRADTLSAAIRFGPMKAELKHEMLVISPVDVRLPGAVAQRGQRNSGEPEGPPSGSLRVEGTLGPVRPNVAAGDWTYHLAVSGETSRAQDLVAIGEALGRPANTEWSVEGAAAVHLTWSGAIRQGMSAPLGTIKLDGLQVSSVLMNEPVIVESAGIELRPGARRVQLDDARAFGAVWKGSLDRRAGDPNWTFDLSANRLEAAMFGEWLAPRATAGLFSRVLPSAAQPRTAAVRELALARLVARGRLRAGEVALGSLHLTNLDADAAMDGRQMTLHRVQSEFYGGRLTGDFAARLSAAPTFDFRGQVARTDLAALAAVAPSLAGRFAGLASGDLTLSARGGSAADLSKSLEGQGVLRIRDAVLRGFDFSSAEEESPVDSLPRGGDHFGGASAKFHFAPGSIRVDQLLFAGRDEQFELSGNVDFARRLDLRIQSIASGAGSGADPDLVARRDVWTVGGTLDAPQISRQTRVARDSALPAARR